MTAENKPWTSWEVAAVRAERSENNVPSCFDMPGRPMNVFSNAAIAELAVFSRWLRESDVKGVVIRSGKSSAFCAGADLAELGLAYDMIMAAPAETRDRAAFDHFFRLSQALRGIEAAGKPVAAAIAGLALGGGGELALATHHRVMVDNPNVAFGLPESLVGLLPGGGGTQRLPDDGIEKALPVLLEGARLSGRPRLLPAWSVLVAAGEEVAAAERWVLSIRQRRNYGTVGWRPADVDHAASIITRKRETFWPSRASGAIAILDCVAQGLPQPFDDAIRTEMQIFSKLIQRREPRNMDQTLFLGRLDHDRLRRQGHSGTSRTGRGGGIRHCMPVRRRTQRLRSAFARAGFHGSDKARVRRRHCTSRSGWRRSLSPTANVHCASGWRRRTPWQTNGALPSRRISAARRTICWLPSTAFPPTWRVHSPPPSPAPDWCRL